MVSTIRLETTHLRGRQILVQSHAPDEEQLRSVSLVSIAVLVVVNHNLFCRLVLIFILMELRAVEQEIDVFVLDGKRRKNFLAPRILRAFVALR